MTSCKIVLDSRELALKELLPEAEVQQLDIGDIQFFMPDENNNDFPIFVIERKKVTDLSASIRDNRSREQRARLLNYCKPKSISVLYLIEEFYTKNSRYSLPKDTLRSALTNLMIRDHIFVYHTNELEESALFIRKIARKLVEFKDHSHNASFAEYTNLLQSRKQDNKTPEKVYLLQLATIPKVSMSIAKVIAKEYPDWNTLLESYNRQPDQVSAENMLADLILTLSTKKSDGTYKTRKLGKVASKQVYTYTYSRSNELCPDDIITI